MGPFVSDSPAPGVYGGKSLSQKIAEATRLTIISLDTRLNGMAASDALLNGLDETLNFRDMLIFRYKVQVYT